MRPTLGALTAAVTVLGAAGVTNTGCAGGSGDVGRVSAADPAVGANPGDSAALYVDLTNHGGTDALVGARCDCSASTSLHLTEDRGGILLMVAAEELELPAGDRTRLRPGGPHVMLEDIGAPLEPGSTVGVTLEFEHSGDLVLEVPVVALEQLAERVSPEQDGTDEGEVG